MGTWRWRLSLVSWTWHVWTSSLYPLVLPMPQLCNGSGSGLCGPFSQYCLSSFFLLVFAASIIWTVSLAFLWRINSTLTQWRSSLCREEEGTCVASCWAPLLPLISGLDACPSCPHRGHACHFTLYVITFTCFYHNSVLKCKLIQSRKWRFFYLFVSHWLCHKC